MELFATLFDFVAISDCLAHILNESMFPFFAVLIQFGLCFCDSFLRCHIKN